MPTPIELDDLTSSLVDGEGVFDVLMRANKAHLEQEFTKNRIKGPEFAQVYLGSLQTVLATALQFVMQKNAANQDILLKDKQIELATAQIAQAAAQTLQVEAQTLLITQQRANLVAEALNIPKQGDLLDAQVAKATKDGELTDQQIANLTAEAVNIPKQGSVLDNQAAKLLKDALQVTQQTANLAAEALNLPKQGAKIDADIALSGQQLLNLTAEKLLTDAKVTQTSQQTANLVSEELNISKQGLLIDANRTHIAQQTLMVEEQVKSEAFRNFVHPTDPTLSGTLEKERQVLIAQECKLKAEFDVLILTKDKTTSETTLLGQKLATEKAQVMSLGVDADSLVGRQKGLYLGQTNGFLRDAEQKAAKLLVDTWSVRRTTNDTTPADSTNKLNDATIGQAVTKLLDGVGV